MEAFLGAVKEFSNVASLCTFSKGQITPAQPRAEEVGTRCAGFGLSWVGGQVAHICESRAGKKLQLSPTNEGHRHRHVVFNLSST